MPPIIRYFTQVSPRPKDGFSPEAKKLNAFLNHHVIAILGEPGLGKTTSLEYNSQAEPNAVFIRVGEFLTSPIGHLQGKILYLDGLDEQRSRADGVNVMDAIIGKLKSLQCPKVRISCRTADWHGTNDLDALTAVNADVVQLALEPLSEHDLASLIENSSDFISGARQNNLESFLHNPQDFLLLNEFYSERQSWPQNRSDLMEGSCQILLQETNETHAQNIDDLISDWDLRDTSDYLAAIMLLSNISGISQTRTRADNTFPCIQSFHGDLSAMRAATRRRVFKYAGAHRIEPKHRRIAEYMAARYLAGQVRRGLSLRRVMALMTGVDGGTPPDLRGVYAWLVTLLAGVADHVLEHDPYGAMIYGDPHTWTPNTKIQAFEALQRLAQRDPWFRGDDHSTEAIGGMSDPVLKDAFENLLNSDSGNPHLLATVFNMIAGGKPNPQMGPALLRFIRSSMKPDFLKGEAIDAFNAACSERTEALLDVMKDVQEGKLKDPHQYLRGALLKVLYPGFIGPDQIVGYLVKPNDRIVGWYHMFVRHYLFERTKGDGLRTIAKDISRRSGPIWETDDYDKNHFIGRLIAKLLLQCGHTVPAHEVLDWLLLGLDEHDMHRIGVDEASAVSDYLNKNDELYCQMFDAYLDQNFQRLKIMHQIWWRYMEVTLRIRPPRSFPVSLLRRIRSESDGEKKLVLYELLCLLVLNDEPELCKITLDELWDLSQSSSHFRDVYERLSCCEVDDWRRDDALRRMQRLAERETRITENREALTRYKDKIESGEALGILEHYARVWYGLFTDVDHDSSPEERLRHELGDELTMSVISGFLSCANLRIFFDVVEIATAAAKGKAYFRGYLLLAAMDVVSRQGREATMALPDETLKLALAYELSNALCNEPEWKQWLYAEKEALVAELLDEFWRAQLAKRPERLSGFYVYNDSAIEIPIIRKILPHILRDHPRSKLMLLNDMIVCGILYCSAKDMLSVIQHVLKN